MFQSKTENQYLEQWHNQKILIEALGLYKFVGFFGWTYKQLAKNSLEIADILLEIVRQRETENKQHKTVMQQLEHNNFNFRFEIVALTRDIVIVHCGHF